MVVTSTPNEVANLYFEWLCLEVGVGEDYWTMMGFLFNREFTWSVANDDNRAADGIGLRDRFLAESGLGEEAYIYGPCSVLEMMVALAERMETDIMYDPELGDRTAEWFWIMVTNLHLDRFDDGSIDQESGDKIRHILDVLVERSYFMNGTGGLFPLKKPTVNQRRVEIWYQMNSYLIENFDF